MSISIILILLTIGASVWAWQTPGAMERFTFIPYRVARYNEYYRFFTSSFLHVSGSHLFFNMFTFFFFGRAVEQDFDQYSPGNGWLILLALYLTAMVVSEIGTFYKNKTDTRYSSVGASGAVAAVLFAGIWFHPTNQILVMFIPMPGFAFGAVYLIYTAYSAKNDFTGHINHDAHFYGSVWGVLFALILFPSSISNFFDALIRFQIF
jgi:membrane associated rhomboid family serine protease